MIPSRSWGKEKKREKKRNRGLTMGPTSGDHAINFNLPVLNICPVVPTRVPRVYGSHEEVGELLVKGSKKPVN
jgi:hypothetical protein